MGTGYRRQQSWGDGLVGGHPLLLFEKMKNSYCFYKARKSGGGVFTEEVGELADRSRATGALPRAGLDPRLSRVCAAMPSTACPLGPSCLTLLFAFCLDVEWTDWFHHDKVSPSKGGEKISDLRAAHPGKICNRPLDIQVPTQNRRVVMKALF